jgi:hypothetical protein
MVDFPKFFSKAAELYELWPSFFNWAAGVILPAIGGLVWAAWWIRGYKAEIREAVLGGQIVALQEQLAAETATLKGELAAEKGQLEAKVAVLMGQMETERAVLKGQVETERAALKGKLEAETAALKGEINVLTQRLELATEQQKAATDQAKIFEVQLAELKSKTSRGEQPSPSEIKNATIVLDIALQRLLAANDAVTSTLTIPGAKRDTGLPKRHDRKRRLPKVTIEGE